MWQIKQQILTTKKLFESKIKLGLPFNGPDLANKFQMFCLKRNLKVEQKPNSEQTYM
jgi:hypothetical protein